MQRLPELDRCVFFINPGEWSTCTIDDPGRMEVRSLFDCLLSHGWHVRLLLSCGTAT